MLGLAKASRAMSLYGNKGNILLSLTVIVADDLFYFLYVI